MLFRSGQLRAIGIRSDADFDRTAATPQSEYTAVVQAMRNKGSNYAQCTGQYTCTVNMRKEATLQGVTSVKVWDCGVQCYDKKFIASGGADVENEYVDTLFLPFYDKKEQKANKMLANYVKYTGANNVDGFGDYAWAAGVAFRDAVNAVVKKDGVNGLTRANLFTALNGIHAFNADGMFGTIDLAGRVASPCHVLMQVQKGQFVRVSPTKPGTFDCAKKNLVHVQLNLFS